MCKVYEVSEGGYGPWDLMITDIDRIIVTAEGSVAQLFDRAGKNDGRFHTLCERKIAEILP